MTSEILHCESSVHVFKRVSRYYSLFHLTFIGLAVLQLVAFLLFFSFFTRSAFLGISIGVIFFTGFAYFVLHFYFQGKKPEEFTSVKQDYLENCKKAISHSLHSPEYQHALTYHLYQLVDSLEEGKNPYYPLPEAFKSLGVFLEKLGVWTYAKQAHQMKEILLLEVVQAQLALVKRDPTDIKVHAGLAGAYRNLGNLYAKEVSEKAQERFSTYMQLVLEEFRIIAYFAPDIPSVYSELAQTYHVLKMPSEELKSYQKLRELLPQDKNVLLRLGELYFEQRARAEALKIYEELLAIDSIYAERLIANYASI